MSQQGSSRLFQLFCCSEWFMDFVGLSYLQPNVFLLLCSFYFYKKLWNKKKKNKIVIIMNANNKQNWNEKSPKSDFQSLWHNNGTKPEKCLISQRAYFNGFKHNNSIE